MPFAGLSIWHVKLCIVYTWVCWKLFHPHSKW